jgi:hypothetical protein
MIQGFNQKLITISKTEKKQGVMMNHSIMMNRVGNLIGKLSNNNHPVVNKSLT